LYDATFCRSTDSLPKDPAKIETGMAEKSSPGARQTDGKNLIRLEKKKEN
jgi:hypothetical protein